MPFQPREIVERSCIRVGNESSTTQICGGRRSALLMSENHRKLRNGAWSGGGPFYVYKKTLAHGSKTVRPFLRNGIPYIYTCCGVSPGSTSLQMTPLPPWTDERLVLQNLYASGYNKARPGNAVAGLGQFLVELRDLPRSPLDAVDTIRKVPFAQVPKVLLERLLLYKNLGSEYLNVAFGWKPFVSDVRKMYNLWHTIDARLAQIIRENGKYIRRKATVSNTSSVTQGLPVRHNLAYINVYGAPPNWFGTTGRTTLTTTSTTKEKVWFVASFRYYIPDVSSSQWNRRARLALLGGLPTPSVLYEVLPWSWLVDWFSNVGDVVSNVSPNAVDNLTMSHSFIMRHVTETTEWTAHVFHPAKDTGAGGSFPNLWAGMDHTYSTTQTVETKSRLGGGNPFGLGVTLSSLSAYQLGILAALGISRSKVQ